MKDRLLIVDFDGVVCNSIDECMFSSYNVYLSSKGLEKVNDLKEIDDKQKNKFYRLRPFIWNGSDYVLLFHIINDKIDVKDQESFNKIRAEYKQNLDRYSADLYEEREFLVKNRKDFWLSLNPLYKAGNLIRDFKSYESFYILSTKKNDYLVEILKHNKINLPSDHVRYCSQSSKLEGLSSILDKNGIDLEDSMFVEDQIESLIDAQKLGIGLYLADWSYINQAQKKKAQKLGIKIINEDDFGKLVRPFMN